MMKAVILAGGKGKRLEPYTTVLPKPLMPVGDMPILEIILKQLKRFGYGEVILAVGHLAGIIEAYFGDGKEFGVKLHYSFESEPLGTVGPLKLIEDLLSKDSFLVMNGDILTDMDFSDFIKFHRAEDSLLTLAVTERRVSIDYGVIHLDGNLIVDFDEKPSPSYWVSMGIYCMKPEIFKYIPKGVKYDIPDLVRDLLNNGERISAYRYTGFWLDIGREEDAKRAQVEFEKRKNFII
jgi:NDP-sugar pyrophosphorylase family protein